MDKDELRRELAKRFPHLPASQIERALHILCRPTRDKKRGPRPLGAGRAREIARRFDRFQEENGRKSVRALEKQFLKTLPLRLRPQANSRGVKTGRASSALANTISWGRTLNLSRPAVIRSVVAARKLGGLLPPSSGTATIVKQAKLAARARKIDLAQMMENAELAERQAQAAVDVLSGGDTFSFVKFPLPK